MPSRMSGSGREPFRMSGRILWIFRSDWLALSDVQEWSGDSPGCPGVVGGTPVCPEVVGRHSRLSGSGQEALSEVQERLGGPTRCLVVVKRSSRLSGSSQKARMTGIGWEALPDVREW